MRTALITGVSGGIGSATAIVFRSHGWRVVGVDCQEPLRKPDVDHFLLGNVASAEFWEKEVLLSPYFEEGLDVLVNIAAVQVSKPIDETTPEEWDAVMSVNLKSAFLGTKFLLPLLTIRPSAIVNVSSVHAFATSKGIAAYAASKGGLTALTRASALDLADKNVRVNAVLPGATDTKMLEDGLSRGHLEADSLAGLKAELAAKTPSGKLGRPEEVAEMILFLADNDRSSFVTGQTFVVDGGALAKLSTE